MVGTIIILHFGTEEVPMLVEVLLIFFLLDRTLLQKFGIIIIKLLHATRCTQIFSGRS